MQPQPQQQAQISGYFGDTIEEASVSAALIVAEAENKSFVLGEAVKEAERVLRMSEDTDTMLQMVNDASIRSKTKSIFKCYLLLFFILFLFIVLT